MNSKCVTNLSVNKFRIVVKDMPDSDFFPSSILLQKRWTRGLIIDIERGNFLKIDRHKYVRVAWTSTALTNLMYDEW